MTNPTSPDVREKIAEKLTDLAEVGGEELEAMAVAIATDGGKVWADCEEGHREHFRRMADAILAPLADGHLRATTGAADASGQTPSRASPVVGEAVSRTAPQETFGVKALVEEAREMAVFLRSVEMRMEADTTTRLADALDHDTFGEEAEISRLRAALEEKTLELDLMLRMSKAWREHLPERGEPFDTLRLLTTNAEQGYLIEKLQADIARTALAKLDGATTTQTATATDGLCEDCPPVGHPTDKTRCTPCPRRMQTGGEHG